MEMLRDLLRGASNKVENPPPTDEYQSRNDPPLSSGGGQNITPPTGGGGMDPWQTSVENRLGSLEGRLGRVEDRLGGVETNTATLTERVSHLPTKGWGVTALLMLFAAVAGVVTFQDNIHHLITGTNASGAPQIQAERNSS